MDFLGMEGVSLPAPRQLQTEAEVGEEGELRLAEPLRQRWGLTPGARLLIQETAGGFLLRPRDPPLGRVYVEPTSACNLSCRTCVRNSWSEPTGSMEMDTYTSLVEGLREVSSVRVVSFWGIGEPLLHPRILDMVAMASGLGARTELITNGLLLDEATARGLIEARLDTLVVSVDGTSSESYAEVRTGANLQQVIHNVTRLNELRATVPGHRPEVGIEFVAMRRNLHELPGLRRLARLIGATFVVVTNVLPYTEELSDEILYSLWGGSDYRVGRSKYAPSIVLPRMDARPEQIEALSGLLGGCAVGGPDLGAPPSERSYCRFVHEGTVAVAWDGQVSPCVALMHSYPCYILHREKRIRRYTVGDVRKQPLARIYDGEEFRRFRDRVLRFDFPPCTDCGACEMVESNEQDCFGNPFPVCGDCLWAKGVIQCP